MKKILALALLIAISPAQAQDIPYDFVTYDTVRQFVKEHPVEFDNWLRVYNYKVKSGAGVTHPRTGKIFTGEGKEQTLANMLSYYAEVRLAKGQTLHSINEKFIIFNFKKILPPPTLPYTRHQQHNR